MTGARILAARAHPEAVAAAMRSPFVAAGRRTGGGNTQHVPRSTPELERTLTAVES
ncbi:hypothetical protein ABC795_12305 [Blastococcus sp. HT6-30]|uniref:hypothetical protein n=1 Tax=Blastococcus sp. HT6-30 TaxID=3144843 RepID=UPI0032191CC3